jgi:hypothetical protein
MAQLFHQFQGNGRLTPEFQFGCTKLSQTAKAASQKDAVNRANSVTCLRFQPADAYEANSSSRLLGARRFAEERIFTTPLFLWELRLCGSLPS